MINILDYTLFKDIKDFHTIWKLEEKKNLLKNLLKVNMDIDTISKVTVLTKDEILKKEFLKGFLKEKAIYERTAFLYKLSEQFEDKDLYEIITSDSYNIRAKLFFVSKIKDRKYLEKLIKELNDKELVEKSKYFLEHLV